MVPIGIGRRCGLELEVLLRYRREARFGIGRRCGLEGELEGEELGKLQRLNGMGIGRKRGLEDKWSISI
jgi:hypothetical protein